MIQDAAAAILIAIGCGFFLAGTAGMLRFPDVFTRLHALTKADNLGLGFVLLGIGVMAGSIAVAVQLLITWIVVLATSSTIAYLISGWAKRAMEHAE